MKEAGRRRFIASLVVFAVWVVGLGAMAIFSGHRPREHPRASAPR